MSGERDSWDELLSRIADGGDVDWDRASRDDATGAGRVAALRDVARIADFSRYAQREADAPAASAPVRAWGPLLLLERLGAGTSGEVWRAWDAALERELAVKMLREDAAADPAALVREGRALAQVRHPNVVLVHGLEQHDGRWGLRMDLVSGTTLERELERRGALGADEATALARDLLGALAAAHAAGVLHRDVKPANLVRDAQGRWVLTDFGLGVKRTDGELALAKRSGTPLFMPPECLDGAPASERADVYAAGATLWWALTGAPPHEAADFDALRAAARRGPEAAALARVAGVTPALRDVLFTALAPVPATPPASASLLGASLAAAPRARRDARMPLAIAALLAITLVTVWVQGRRPPAPRASAPAPAPVATATDASAPYAIEATLQRHDASGSHVLADGDRVKPGDQLTLALHATKRVWVYVLDGDERGETWLLFPQPLFDVRNPIEPGRDVQLPGAVGGRASGWTVTSRGGREHVLVVASPEPVADLEAALATLPAPSLDRPVSYARVGAEPLERLRGVGGVSALPEPPRARGPAPLFEHFRALAGGESGVRGTWVRQVTLENPLR